MILCACILQSPCALHTVSDSQGVGAKKTFICMCSQDVGYVDPDRRVSLTFAPIFLFFGFSLFLHSPFPQQSIQNMSNVRRSHQYSTCRCFGLEQTYSFFFYFFLNCTYQSQGMCGDEKWKISGGWGWKKMCWFKSIIELF